MLRGWLRTSLPGPAPPAWEGAGAARRGLSCRLGARAAATEAAAAAEEEEEKEEGGRGPRAAGLAGGAPGPGAAAAAAGFPRSSLSAPLFVSAPGEGRVMSLLPGAGKQRRDKVTYPAPCPRPASPRSAASAPAGAAGLGRAGRAPRLQEARPGRALSARVGLRGWVQKGSAGRKLHQGPDLCPPNPRVPPSAFAPAPPAAREVGSAQDSPGAARSCRQETPPGGAGNQDPDQGRELDRSSHQQSAVYLHNLQKTLIKLHSYSGLGHVLTEGRCLM